MRIENRTQVDDEKEELLNSISACRQAITKNQALLAKLVHQYRSEFPQDPLPLWADRYMVFRGVPIAVPTDFLDGNTKIQRLLLEARTVFWRRILESRHPQRAFIRWVQHVFEISTGACRCDRLERFILHRE